jgi:hypothetical protein
LFDAELLWYHSLRALKTGRYRSRNLGSTEEGEKTMKASIGRRGLLLGASLPADIGAAVSTISENAPTVQTEARV